MWLAHFALAHHCHPFKHSSSCCSYHRHSNLEVQVRFSAWSNGQRVAMQGVNTQPLIWFLVHVDQESSSATVHQTC